MIPEILSFNYYLEFSQQQQNSPSIQKKIYYTFIILSKFLQKRGLA